MTDEQYAEIVRRLEQIENLMRFHFTAAHRRIFTLKEFAALVGRKTSTISRWCDEGRIKYRRDGGAKLQRAISRDEYDRYLEEGLRDPVDREP